MKQTIGLILSDKKWTELGLPLQSTLESMTEAIQVKRIHYSTLKQSNLVAQGPFDLILQKMNDVYYAAEHEKEPWALAFLRQFESLVATHSGPSAGLVVLDPLSKTWRMLMNRLSITQLLTAFLDQHSMFKQKCCLPNSMVAQDWQGLLEEKVRPSLAFPWIVKQGQACSGPTSHFMWMIRNEAGLRLLYERSKETELSFPLLVQEYIPHHPSLLLKVYVMGEDYDVVQRPSLDASQNDQGLFFFNSQKMEKSNEGSGSAAPLLFSTTISTTSTSLIDVAFIAQLIPKLRAYLGLDLFGLDMVVHETSGLYYIVDLNYFPGYHGIPRRFHRLAEFILSKLNPPLEIR